MSRGLSALGRAGDVGQLALGAGLLRPAFRWLYRARPELALRMRHEVFAARGDEFVRSVGKLEKAAFLAKMLGTDGAFAREPATGLGDETTGGFDPAELLIAGDLLFPGALGADSLSPALRARIARADAFVVNLEATVAATAHELAPLLTARGLTQLLAYEDDPASSTWVSRVEPEGLRSLLACAQRALVTVANNHTLDEGIDGFARTVDLVRAMGIGVIGDARSDHGAELVRVGAHRVAVLAIAYGSNRSGDGRCHLRFDAVPYALDPGRVRALVAEQGWCGATHVVVVLHWGYEHEHEPSADQHRCVEVLLEHGVSAVVGHHPHLLQASEAGAGRWVSYSLGDFIGGDRTIWSRFGAMVALRFGPDAAVRGELVPVAQTPFWERHATVLLEEAPRFEQRVFDRWFRSKLGRRRPGRSTTGGAS